MGLHDRDYYHEHRDALERGSALERGNELWLRSRSISAASWFGRLFVLALVCAVVYLVVEVLRLRKELEKSDRAVQQLTEQMRYDRQRAGQQRAPAPQRPTVEFFK